MPPASSAAQPRRRSRTAPAARSRPRLTLRDSALRVRWERLGRVVLVGVFAIVLGLYLKQGLSLLGTHSQAAGQQAIVQRLARENRRLERERAALSDPATIELDARKLGMVNPGERPYVVTGLHPH